MPFSPSDERYLRLEIDPLDTPVSQDLEADRALLGAILDYCESPQWDDQQTADPSRFGALTTWVSWQLGIVAEYHIVHQNYGLAWRVALMGVIAARSIRSESRLAANLLTMGNVCMAIDDIDSAQFTYLSLIQLPWSAGRPERHAALISLGSIAHARADFRRSAYYTERGLFSLGSKLTRENYLKIIGGLRDAYGELGDLAGSAFLLCQFQRGDPKPQLREVMASANLETALRLTTRLHWLGEHEVAEHCRHAWVSESNYRKNLR